VFGEADGRPQVALVGRHAAVDGRGGEETGLGRRDEEGLWPRTPLGLFALVVLLPFGSSILGGGGTLLYGEADSSKCIVTHGGDKYLTTA